MRLEQITFLRFVAAMAVVVFHFGRDAPLLSWANPVWDVSNSAVSFFYFLSGFILTHVYGARGLTNRRSFYVARVARIAPLYFLALGLMAVLEWRNGRLEALDLALSMGLVQSWVPGSSQVVNAPAWSLSVEVFFYLLFPFVLPQLQRIGRTRTLLAALLACWLVNLAVHIALVQEVAGLPESAPLSDFTFYSPITHVGTFLCGGLGALLFSRQAAWFKRHAVACMAGSSALGLALVLLDAPILRYHHNGLFVPLFLLFVGGLASRGDLLLSRVFSWPPFVVLGEISYGIYILQIGVWNVFIAVLTRTGVEVSLDVRFGLFALVLCAVSYVAYRLVEKPARSAIRARFA